MHDVASALTALKEGTDRHDRRVNCSYISVKAVNATTDILHVSPLLNAEAANVFQVKGRQELVSS